MMWVPGAEKSYNVTLFYMKIRLNHRIYETLNLLYGCTVCTKD
jgi:hypothetical protein